MGALAQRLKPVLMPALLALLLALLPGRGWLPGDWRLVEGLTAFTPQWLALALALGVRALWRGQRLRALVFVLLATPDLVSALRPEAGRPDAGRLAAPGTDFTLYAANLGEDPAALGVALETLQATAPDVIWLSEVPATRPAALEEAFDVMAAAYPYGMAWAPAPGRELRFLSRFPCGQGKSSTRSGRGGGRACASCLMCRGSSSPFMPCTPIRLRKPGA